MILLATTLMMHAAEAVTGTVRADGRPLAGVQVVARSHAAKVAHGTVTGADGRFHLPVDGSGPFRVELAGIGWRAPGVDSVRPGARVDLVATAVPAAERSHHASSWLGLLPEGEAKRKFILDCTGCHQFNETRALKAGAPRTAEQWATDAARMLGFAGASSNFPVIAADRDPAATGRFVHDAVSARFPAGLAERPAHTAAAARAVVTEYDLPVAQDLPHDVAVDSSGRIVVTGMFSHRMFVLDPATAAVTETPIPVQGANPRAVELDAAGNWWVLLGGPRRVARYDVRSREWTSFPIEMYPHSIAVAPDGASAWFNGHFTKKPILIGRLDAGTGQVERFEAPLHPVLSDAGGPVPYEQRMAPDGTIWMSELIGNRMVSFDPRTRRFEALDMPSPHSGPRRFDVARDGTLWIPAYSGNALVRLDPKTRRFTELPLPVPDAVPYVARVNHRTGDVWIGTAAADAVIRYEPARQRFTVYPVLTRGATMRHMAIDPRTGDVWLAYGASPALHPSRVARVRVGAE